MSIGINLRDESPSADDEAIELLRIFLDVFGAEIGQFVKLKFNLTNCIAQARLGDPNSIKILAEFRKHSRMITSMSSEYIKFG